MRIKLPVIFFSSLCLTLLFINKTFAQDNLGDQVLQIIKKQPTKIHITGSDAENAVVTSSYTDQSSGIEYVYLQQQYQHISVYNSIITIAIKNNSILYSSGKFVADIETKASSVNPVVLPEEAIKKTANHLLLKQPVDLKRSFEAKGYNKILFTDGGIAKRGIEASLQWASVDDGATVHLVWNINIDVLKSPDWWNVRVDALTGDFVDKDNWTVHEAAVGNSLSRRNRPADQAQTLALAKTNNNLPPTVTNADYLVVPFPYESAGHTALAVDNNPWLRAGAGNSANTYGWHFDGTTNYTTTRGNNVYAYEDVNADNLPGVSATSTTAVPSLTFNFTPNFTLAPTTATNQSLAITNLFYWNNLMHDVMYQYGFTEAAGNFQNDNLGRGGTGSDYVLAEAQDGSGTDNANFNTPVDGTSGRMQMYLWTSPTAPTLTVNTPVSIAGNYACIESAFSTANKLTDVGPVTGQVIYFNDDAGGTTHLACASPANSVTGKIVLIDRGTCNFVVKIKDAQTAGAKAAIVINNVATAPISMGGTDNTIIIPAVMVSQADGAILAGKVASNENVTLASTGVKLDGDLDNGVMCHEYGHGISNRLTGGPANTSCLSNAEEGGEGWSDYFALMMTTNWTTAKTTDGTVNRPIGTYVFGEGPSGAGIRTYPYSTDMSVNPHTYADLKNVSTEVHYIGEVWCSAIWDMTWSIIQQTGSITNNLYNSAGAGGNVIALNLVIEGLKLQPCSPGFLDARDAILAADSILYNNAHKCAIWNAFARRGMGVSAVQGSSTSATDQTPAYDVPSSVSLVKTITPVNILSGQQFIITTTATCTCQTPLNNLTVTDTIPSGFGYISSSPGGVLSSNVVTFNPVNFATSNQSQSYTVTVQANTPGCNIDSAINDNRETLQVGGLTSAIISGVSSWASSSTQSHSTANSWNAPDAATPTEFTLTSGSVTPAALSILSFWHYFDTETGYDGGVVEITSNDGTSWQDAGPYILQNGYNTTMDSSTILVGKKAYSGSTNGQFIQTIINLSSFSGKTIKLRFRMTTDNGNAGNPTATGWYIDDIVLADGCGGFVKTVLLNTSGTKTDGVLTPLFVRPGTTTPQTLIRFSAQKIAQNILLSWLTANEINTESYVVQHSVDGINWTDLVSLPAKNNVSANYQLYDNDPVIGVNYYRLKIIDNNTGFKYSPVQKILFDKNDTQGLVVVPNPANDFVNINFKQNIISPQVFVTDANGKMVMKYMLKGTLNNFKISTDKLAAGIYTVNVKSADNVYTSKIVVVHP